jgi:hypothetical protein
MLLILYLPTLFVTKPTEPTFLSVQQAATHISVSFMTELAGTPTFVPLSNEDGISLQERYLNEFETELGFLHPVLEETVVSLVQGIKSEIQLMNQRHVVGNPIPENIIHSIHRTTFEGIEYIALVTLRWTNGTLNQQGIIFSATNDSVILLAQVDECRWIEDF